MLQFSVKVLVYSTREEGGRKEGEGSQRNEWEHTWKSSYKARIPQKRGIPQKHGRQRQDLKAGPWNYGEESKKSKL